MQQATHRQEGEGTRSSSAADGKNRRARQDKEALESGICTRRINKHTHTNTNTYMHIRTCIHHMGTAAPPPLRAAHVLQRGTAATRRVRRCSGPLTWSTQPPATSHRHSTPRSTARAGNTPAPPTPVAPLPHPAAVSCIGLFSACATSRQTQSKVGAAHAGTAAPSRTKRKPRQASAHEAPPPPPAPTQPTAAAAVGHTHTAEAHGVMYKNKEKGKQETREKERSEKRV